MGAATTPRRLYAGVSATDRVAERRTRLVDAAIELYGTDGYAATGVKDICRVAGVTDRYFYESFRNQPELFRAAFQHCVSQLLAAVAAAVAAAPVDAAAQGQAAIGTFVRALAADRRVARILFVESASVGGDTERDVRASIRQFADLIAATARRHVPNVPDQLLTMGALSLVGAIQHVLIEWLDGNLDATVEEMIDYFTEVLSTAATAATAHAAVTRPSASS
jgi:AcrR family transcriptional regulator